MKSKKSLIVFVISLALLLTVLVLRRVQINRIWPEDYPLPQAQSAEPLPEDAEGPESPAPLFEEQTYLLSVVGDCTLASPQFIDATEHRSIEYHIQKDYAYPFSFTKE